MNHDGIRFTLIAVFTAFLTACQLNPMSSSNVGLSGSGQLDDTSWHVKNIDGNKVVFNAMITIAFEAGRLSGVAGCNSYFGTLAPADDPVIFGQIGSTRRACEPALMDQEQKFLHTLANIASYRIEQDAVLLLFDVDGNLRIRATLNQVDNNAMTETVPQDAVASHESVFRCDESRQLRVKFVGPETINLWVGDSGDSSILSRSRSASGARYQNARYEFWNSGEDARLIDNGQEYKCLRHH